MQHFFDLTDGYGPVEARLRVWADAVGLDPWDVDLAEMRAWAAANERPPVSRFRVGSPCRFVRRIDLAMHLVIPAMVVERHPGWALALCATSPRWGTRRRPSG